MELSEIRDTRWAINKDGGSGDKKIECKNADNSEMSTCVETHCDKSSDGTPESINSSKCGFKQQFVEESTLRSVALDELEELSEIAIVGTDGDVLGRTSSTASSEQRPVKYAFIFEWDKEYIRKPEGIARLALLSCTTMSLACVTTAGTSEQDILEFSISSYIRAHIFVTVFSLLITSVLFTIHITSIINSFPIYWNIIDAAINAFLSMLFIFSSSLLLNAQKEKQHQAHFIEEWTKLQLLLAVIFGYLSMLFCAFLTVIRSCKRPSSPTSEDIILTSIRNS